MAEAARECRAVDTNTAYIERGSPWKTAPVTGRPDILAHARTRA